MKRNGGVPGQIDLKRRCLALSHGLWIPSGSFDKPPQEICQLLCVDAVLVQHEAGNAVDVAQIQLVVLILGAPGGQDYRIFRQFFRELRVVYSRAKKFSITPVSLGIFAPLVPLSRAFPHFFTPAGREDGLIHGKDNHHGHAAVFAAVR